MRTASRAFFFAGRTFFMALIFANMSTNFCLIADFLARLVKETAKAFSAISCTVVSTLKNFSTRSQAVIERNRSGTIASAFGFTVDAFLGTCRTVLVNKFSA